MNLVRAAATIGGLTLISRIAGFVRDVLMARFLGAGLASDCFLIAFRLPNLFRSLFAEGAFSAAFVPMFARTLKAEGGDLSAGRRFAEDVLSVLLPLLVAFTALMLVAAGPIVWVLTGGFADAAPGKFALAVEYTRLTFPYLALVSLAAMLGGVLNSLGRFWAYAAAPILLNLTLMGALLFFRGDTEVATGRAIAVAVSLAGVAQFAWMLWACLSAEVKLRLRVPRLTPDVKRLLTIIGPAALGAGAVQFNLLVSTALAARFLNEGAISWLYYADRLNQLPLGLIGIGVGTALLPALSRQLGNGLTEVAMHTQNRAVELVLLLGLPAAAAFAASAEPIVRALFMSGKFGAADAAQTAAALGIFALGLPAYVLIKVLLPGFYARSDTRTPVLLSLVAIAVNLIGNLILIWPLGHVGIAVATAVSAWVNVALLWWFLAKRGHFHADARLKRNGWRLLAAATAMAAALLLANGPVLAASTPGGLMRVLPLAALIGLGALAYAAAAALLGAVSLADLKQQLSRSNRI